MSKYKIGDVVLIKQDAEMIIPLTPETALIMEKYEGKEATIIQTDVNAFLGIPMYKLDIDNGLLVWDESVLAPAKGLQKISNLESIQNNKNNIKNEEDEIMISDYKVEDCTIFDKTSGHGKHVKGKRTILEWTDGTVTIVECPDAEFNAYNGFAIALAKKAMGNDNTMTNLADFWINKLPAKNAKIQAEIEKCKAEERRIAEKRKAKKEKWQMRQAVLARKRAYEEAQKQRAVAEIAEREFGVPIDFKAE